jgi:WD40 repeat protein
MKASLVLVAACGPASVLPAAPGAVADPMAATFGAAQWRVPDTVDHIAFSADDKAIIVGTQHGTVVRFQIDGTRELVIEGALAEVTEFADLPGELVLGGNPPVVVDLANHTRHAFGVTGAVSAIAVAGRRAIVASDDGPLFVMNRDTGTKAPQLEHSSGFSDPVIAGDWVIAGRRERAVGIWELATGKRHRVFALGNNAVFALSPDHRWIVTGTFTRRPRWELDIYDVEDGKRAATIGFSCNPDVAAISPDGALLAVACDDEVRLVKVPSGEQVASLKGPGSHVRTAAWSPSGKLLAVGGNDNVLHVWRAPAWESLTRVVGSRGAVRELDVGSRYLVAHAWGDSSAWLWVTDRVKPVVELGGPLRDVMATAIAGDEVLLVVTLIDRDRDRVAAIERWRNGTRIARAILPNGGYFSPLVSELGGLADGGVWYVANGRVTTLDPGLHVTWTSPEVAAPGEPVPGYAGATQDGRRVVVHSRDVAHMIDAVAHRVIARGALVDCGASPPAVAPDGVTAAVIDPTGITILSTTTAQPVGSLAFPYGNPADRAITWASSDEVVGLAAGKLVVWKLGDATAQVLPAPNTTSVAVIADRIYLGRGDGTVERHTFTTLRAHAASLAAKPAAPCEPGRLESSGFATWMGDDPPRGRLDDAGAYDEPDLAPPGPPAESPD